MKFLGVHIDESLTWHEHVGVVCNRVAKAVGIIYRLRHFPRHILVMLYYALIFSHVNYCNIAWSNNHDYFITKLFVLQKRAIRIISNSPYHAHTLPIFSQLNLLNVYDINRLNIAIFMFMCSRGLLPSPITSKFILNSNIHNYNTRNAVEYHLPKVRTNISKFTIFYKGPHLWSTIPNHLKNQPSLNSFKRSFRLFLSNLYSTT